MLFIPETCISPACLEKTDANYQQVAAAGANSTVVLGGTFNTTTSTTLQTGQTLMGAGTLSVRTASGRTATVNTPGATINGSDIPTANGTITMGANSTLRGMNINDTETNIGSNSIAVRSSGVSNVSIINNTITSNAALGTSSTSHVITLSGGSNHLVDGNTLTANGDGNIALALQFSSASGVASNNHLTASGGGSDWYFVHNTATMLAGSTGNTAGSGTCKLSVVVRAACSLRTRRAVRSVCDELKNTGYRLGGQVLPGLVIRRGAEARLL